LNEAQAKLAKIKELITALENDLSEIKGILRGGKKNV
jgi:archaellum component FlaC